MNKEFLIGPKLPPRECEVVSNEAKLALRGGAAHFVFRLAPGFLPTIGWLGRFAELLPALLESKRAELAAIQAKLAELKASYNASLAKREELNQSSQRTEPPPPAEQDGKR
jgi:hypothetical protein